MKRALYFLVGVLCLNIPLSVYSQNCSVNADVDQTICFSQPMTLNGQVSGSLPAGYVTTWSQVGGPSVVITSPNSLVTSVTGYTGGNQYTFRLSTTCLDGTPTFDLVRFTVQSHTIANAGPDMASCPGSNVGNMAANPVGANENGAWTRVGANNAGVTLGSTTSPTSSISLAATSAGNTTLRWTISNTNGCSSYDDVVITNYGGVSPVNAGPDQNLSSCFSTTATATLAASFGGNNTGGQRGQWVLVSGPNNPTFSNIYANNSTVSGLVPGTYVLRWVVAGPCVNGSDEMTIVVPQPVGAVTSLGSIADQVFCDYRQSAVLTGPTPLYINETSLWQYVSGPSGSTAPTIVDPTNPITQVLFNASGEPRTGRYRFRYTITNSLTGCNNTDGTVDITFNQNPTLTIINDIVLPCNTTNAISGTHSGSGTPQYRYVSWPSGFTPPTTNWTDVASSGGGNWSQAINNLNNAGTYFFQVRKSSGTNNNCGTAFEDINITVSRSPSTANAGTDQNLACNVTSTNLVGNNPIIGFGTWYQVSGPNTATIANIYQNNSAMSNLIPGLYVFRWVITAGMVCPSNQDDVIIRVASATPTQANAGPDGGSCFGTPYPLQGNVPALNESGSWAVSPSTGITFTPNASAPNAVVNGMAASTVYRFIWTLSNACGVTHDTMFVTTTGTQGAPLASAGSDQCLASGTTSTVLNGNNPAPGTGQWTAVPPGGVTFSPNANTQNATANGLNDGTYLFIWSISVTGCSTTQDTVVVTISAPVTPANAGPDQQICGTGTNLAGNLPAVGTGAWTQTAGPPGVTFTNSLLHNTAVSFTYAGQYTFNWKISNSACPSSDDNVTIIVNLPPEAAAAGKDSVYCNITSLPVTMNLYATAVTSGYGIWTFVSGPTTPTIANVLSPTSQLSGLQAGTYILRWSVYSGPFCPPNTDDIQITIIPKANAGADAGFCDITEVSLTGNAGSTGTWTQVPTAAPPATIVSNGPNTAIATALVGGNIYKFRYAMSAGSCISADTVQYTISLPATTASAGSDLEYCQPVLPVRDTFYLSGNLPGSGETGAWSRLSGPVTGTFLPNASSPNAKFVPGGATLEGRVGIYVFTWTITNGSCTNADQVRVTNYARPSLANAGPDQTIACDTFAIMAATTPATGIGIWTQVYGPAGPIIQAPYNAQSVISNLKPAVYPTTYKFLWTVSNGVCTPNSDTVYVIVYEKPVQPNAGPDQNLCNVSSTSLQGNTIGTGTGTWSQVPGGPSTATIVSPTSPTTQVNDLVFGTYRFVWTSSIPPCALTDTVVITNYQNPSTANAGPDQNLCQFDQLFLNATPATIGTGAWTQFSGPNQANILNPSSASTQVIGFVLGTYRFVWTITNGTCTASSDTVQVVITEIPSLAIAGPDQRFCNVTSAILTGSTPTVGTGTWTKVLGNDANIVSPNSPQTEVQDLTPGTYRFEWKIANGNCISKDTMQLIIDALIVSNAGPNQSFCSNVTSTAMAGNDPSPGIGLWKKVSGPAATIVTPASPTTQITGMTIGSYVFRWVITNGLCKDSSTVNVVINTAVNYGTLASGDQTLCYDADPSNITFSPLPSGGSGSFSFQWYFQDGIVNCPSGTNTSGWTLIDGATGNSYDPPAGLTGSRTYAVTVDPTGDPDCGPATWATSCRKVTVYPLFNAGTLASGDETICYNGDPAAIDFSQIPSGAAGTFSYLWYYRDGIVACPTGTDNSGWTLISGATSSSYDPPTGLTGSRTYAVMVDPTGAPDCGIPTWAAGCRQVTVYQNVITGTLSIGDESICYNGDPAQITFSALSSGGAGSFSYQWYYRNGIVECPSGTDNSGWTAIDNAISDNYDPPAGLTQSRTYAVMVDATGLPDCGTATWATSCRKVTVNPLPTITVTTPATCAPNGLTYSVGVTVSTGTVTSTAGTVTNTGGNVWSISAIPAGTNITITVTDANNCENFVNVISPVCILPGNIGNYVWIDSNANGIQDSGEPGQAGVTVNLLDGNGDPVLDGNNNPITTVTDVNGLYSFTGLIPGTYSVGFVLPSGYIFSPLDADNQGIDGAVNSDANVGTGQTTSVTLTSGQTNNNLDAGLYQAVSLGNYVWIDSDANGIQESGEPGIAGVTVNLLDGNGDPVLDGNNNPITTVTDGNGFYNFTGLIPGTYSVGFVLPSGYIFSPLDADNQGIDGVVNSDANVGTGQTTSVTLTSGQTNNNLDAGLYQLASLGNYVWIDSNANGIQESGEPGQAGVTVNLLDGSGNPVLDGNNNPITTVTDGSGFYNFTGLLPGTYSVGFVLPDGYLFTEPDADNQGINGAVNSDANVGTGKTTSVTLTSGQTNNNLDAGLYQAVSLGNYVWIDSNANGIQESGEPGQAGVTVNLLDGSGNPVLDGNGDPITTVTDGNGFYNFTGLIPGTYSVGFELPSGYIFSPLDADNQGIDGAVNSDANVGTGKTTSVTLTSGQTNNNLDAGVYQSVSLGDFVWIDSNADGIQDDGEPGLAGVTVNLLDGNGDPVLDGNGDPITTVTDGDGFYSFTGLIPGTYSVGFVLPDGYLFTQQNADNQGIDGAVNSDANQTTGITISITIISGENNINLDAGLIQFGVTSWVYLEGAAIDPECLDAYYEVPMRSDLNRLHLLPGQSYEDFYGEIVYTPAGQPYSSAPWNYNGTEGDGFDSGGNPEPGDAGYDPTVVDWILVSLKTSPLEEPQYQKAALLHQDGSIEFTDGFFDGEISFSEKYYLVIEHRNHLIVMSDTAISIINGKITYDFRNTQSFIDNPAAYGQKEILPGVFAMYAGNGDQVSTGSSDTSINNSDLLYWEGQNGLIGRYSTGDYNLNGDVNYYDKAVWFLNNSISTSVPGN